MGDDIRDRFRGVRRDYSGPVRPPMAGQKPPAPQQPTPPTQAQPRPTPRPAQNVPLNVFGQPIASAPAARPAPRPVPITHTVPQSKPAKSKRKRSGGKKKLLLIIPLVLLLLGGGAAGAFYLKQKKQTNKPQAATNQQASQPSTPTPTGTITMLMTGDFSAYDSVNKAAQSGGSYNYLPIMQSLKAVFDKYDLRYCNQFSLGGGIGLGVSGYPTFNAPTEWSKGLEDLGCNIINVGSSHANDKGQDAITAALNYYDNHKNILAIAGVNRTAEEQAAVRYFTYKQVKFAYVSYTTSSQKPPTQPYSVNLYNADTAKKQLKEAREKAQFVMVGINWGKEDSGDVQPEQETIAQALVTDGADLVIGNGSHVVQPVKILNGEGGRQGLVWFSLGNAVNSQLPSDNLFGGIAVVNIDVATQNMTNPGFLPTYMHYEWTQAEKSGGKLDARRNLGWYPLDTSKDLLAKSLNNTTVEAQTERLKGIVTKFVPVKMLKSTEL